MTVLITGTSSGIGLSIAKKYLDLSIPVIGVSRRNSPLQEDINYSHISADLTREESLNTLLSRLNMCEDITRFIHAAGSNIRKPFVDFTSDDIQSLTYLNFLSCLFLTQHILQKQTFIESVTVPCRFLAISSIWSYIGAPYRSIYGTTKASLDSLYRHLSSEYLNFNHRFMTIQLGFTDTPLTSLSINDESLTPYFKRFLNHNPFSLDDVSSMIFEQIESPLFPSTINLKIDSGLACL